VSPYCSLPHQIDAWFKAFKKAKEMCGGSSTERRFIPEREIKYLDALVRGVYARRDLPAGHVLRHETIDDDFYLAIPLQKGQLSCRELLSGEVLATPLVKNQALMIDALSTSYATNSSLKQAIYARGQ
jgi:N-acetylneuraminate synthase